MTVTKGVTKDLYTEAEAARALNISVARLHDLLDRYIFNEGTRRPADIEFNSSDLLLAYWNKEFQPKGDKRLGNVVSMPRK